MKTLRLKPGDKLKFRGMKKPFPVVACNRYFAICAYKLTGCLANKEYVYTIVDWANERRGPDSMIFGPDRNYLDPKQAAKALRDLGKGGMVRSVCKQRGPYYGKYVWHDPKLETSRRRAAPLDIEKVIKAPTP